MKNVSTVSIYTLSNAAMLAVRVENPPVATVVSEWQMASHHVMPPARNSTNSTAARMRYTPHSILAVEAIRGSMRSLVGPGISARNNCIPPAPENGSTAITNTSTPMPPINWVSARQSRMPRGTPSSTGITVAPVVVRPETDSKIAAMGEAITPESQ